MLNMNFLENKSLTYIVYLFGPNVKMCSVNVHFEFRKTIFEYEPGVNSWTRKGTVTSRNLDKLSRPEQ